MGQIININIGKVGVRIGQQFINKIANEHFSQHNQKKGKSHVFFHEKQKIQQSRSIFIDLDTRNIDKINLQRKAHIIKSTNLLQQSIVHTDIFASYGCLIQSDIVNRTVQAIRSQAQACDLLSGFVILNNLGSCSGGLNRQILFSLRQNYGYKAIQTHNIMPDMQSSCSPIQIYNSSLSLLNILDSSSMTILSENQACIDRLKWQGNFRPTTEQMNDVFAESICELTAPYRFGGSLNTSQGKILTNLILFPRMKFLIPSFYSRKNKLSSLQCALKSENRLISNIFEDPRGISDIYTMSVHCRDSFAYQEQINASVNSWMAQKKLKPCEWIQNTMHSSISDQINERPSSSILINSRYVSRLFSKLSNRFIALHRRKAFTSHFTSRGMDEMQLTQAQSNINDLISQYDYEGQVSDSSSYFQ